MNYNKLIGAVGVFLVTTALPIYMGVVHNEINLLLGLLSMFPTLVLAYIFMILPFMLLFGETTIQKQISGFTQYWKD